MAWRSTSTFRCSRRPGAGCGSRTASPSSRVARVRASTATPSSCRRFSEAMRRLAIATGDPAGIGPEIAVRAAADVAVRTVADVTLVGDGRRLADLAERLGVDPPAGGIVDVGGSGHRPGEVGAASGHAAVAAIRAAVAEVTAGRADAL